MKITTGDTMHVYGAIGAGVDYAVRFKVRLKDKIDPDALKSSVASASLRFPYFMGRLVSTAESFEYADNDLPIAVINSDARVILNSAMTNYHVWAVSFLDDFFYLDFFHGITDGTGMYRVLATILYHYCKNVYGIDAIPELEASDIEAEMADPQDTIEEVPAPEASYTPAFALETDGGLTKSSPVIWDVKIPEDAFIKFVRENDSTPGTMVELLMGKAINRFILTGQNPSSVLMS